MDFTVSQFHSFTKRQGGWGKNRGQGSGVRDQGSGIRKTATEGARGTGAVLVCSSIME
jgi:hypothetical protein